MNEAKIRLRAMEPEDLDVLYLIENDRTLWNVGVTNVPYSRYALHQYMASQTGDAFADRQVRLIIKDATGQTVGIVDLINFEPQHRRAEVGIVVMDGQRRRGYAAATLREIAGYAAHTLHIHQLYAYVAEDNLPSLHLFEKAGYTTHSLLKDWLFDGKEYHNAILLQLFL